MRARVVEGGSVEEDAEGAPETGGREDVEEEAVDDHADVLPVPLLLRKKQPHRQDMNQQWEEKTTPSSGHESTMGRKDNRKQR